MNRYNRFRDNAREVFQTPVENALCRCQFRKKWVKNRRYPYWIFTPSESVLSNQVPDVCAKFHQNRLSDRESADRQTHTQTHRDDRGDLIICPMHNNPVLHHPLAVSEMTFSSSGSAMTM